MSRTSDLAGPAGRRMLLIHPGALGDLVQAFPAFGAVRAGLPGVHLALLTDVALAPLARETALFDEVIGFHAELAYHGSLTARSRLLGHLILRVRRARPNVAAVFKGAPVYAALAAASGARRRVGLARGWGRRWLTHPVPIAPTRHREDRYFDVVAALGLETSHSVGAAWPVVGDMTDTLLGQRGRPLIGLAPGGARNAKHDMPARRWPAERFAALARALTDAHPGAGFVLLGGGGDRAEVDAVRAVLPPERVVDLAGRVPLEVSRAAIARLDVYVGNDSGLMHVAATTDTPLVVPFGPTDPRVAAPRVPGMRAVWNPAPNAPCYDEVDGTLRCAVRPCCTERVTVARVAETVEAALATARRATR